MNEASPITAAIEQQERARDPVDISESARQQFAEWGLSDSHVQELQTAVGRYEYGAADKKAQRAIDAGIFVDTDNNTFVLPGNVDYVGDRTDGQCSEIALRTYGDLRKEWLDGVNTERQTRGQKPLAVEFTSGQSGEYFNGAKALHFWTTLTDGVVPQEKSVMLDGSLRKIGITDEENYTVEESIAPTEIHRDTTPVIALGEFRRDVDGWPMIDKVPPSWTLGMSENGSATLTFGFMREDDNDTILPTVMVMTPSGDYGICFAGGNERGTNWVVTNPDMSVNLEDRDEAEKLLSMLSAAELTRASETEIAAVITPEQHITF
jgi:hypothetical protein